MSAPQVKSYGHKSLIAIESDEQGLALYLSPADARELGTELIQHADCMAPVAAPVQGTVGRGLMTELYGICAGMSRQEWEDPELASIRLAAELARLGWVHSSQATGGGLSGEALQLLNFALDHLGADVEHGGGEAAWKEKIISDMAAARVELAALPARGDGRGVGT